MEEPIVKKISKENDMFSIKFADNKVVKVQRQFLTLLEAADDQEKDNQPIEGAKATSSTECPTDATDVDSEANTTEENAEKQESEENAEEQLSEEERIAKIRGNTNRILGCFK